MLTPAQWTAAMAETVPWQVAYKEAARITRNYLLAHPLAEDGSLSTHELVEALFPEQLARGDGVYARRRLYKALMAQTIRDLADCCTRGPEQRLYGEAKGGPKIRPWRWHQPTQANLEQVSRRCPKCGQEIF